MIRKIKCTIEKCNSYIKYQHLGLCKKHYNKLLGLGWSNPTMYMDHKSAKRVIENNFKFRKEE